MAKMADVTVSSRIFDPCCGTGAGSGGHIWGLAARFDKLAPVLAQLATYGDCMKFPADVIAGGFLIAAWEAAASNADESMENAIKQMEARRRSQQQHDCLYVHTPHAPRLVL